MLDDPLTYLIVFFIAPSIEFSRSTFSFSLFRYCLCCLVLSDATNLTPSGSSSVTRIGLGLSKVLLPILVTDFVIRSLLVIDFKIL
jgi:hypothetical protein